MLSTIKVVLGAVVHIDLLDAWTNRGSASAIVKMVLRAPWKAPRQGHWRKDGPEPPWFVSRRNGV
jgi:hypothetical protein